MKYGFTLPEVCAALAVFLVGIAGLLGGWSFFNREIADERYCLERFYDVQSAVESLIADAPLCADSLMTLERPVERRLASGQNVVTVRLDRIPGNGRLAWAVVELDGFSLQRLVRCK